MWGDLIKFWFVFHWWLCVCHPSVCLLWNVGVLVLFPILKKYFQLFIIECDVSSRHIVYDLYYIEIYFLCIQFWRTFIINRCWILPQSFSASVEIVIWFLFFSLLGGVSHWCMDIMLSLFPWDKFHLIMVLLFSC